jgi:hypothetical protein
MKLLAAFEALLALLSAASCWGSASEAAADVERGRRCSLMVGRRVLDAATQADLQASEVQGCRPA